MAELVEDGDADLLAELPRLGKVLRERQVVDRDRVRLERRLNAPLGQRHAVVEAEEIGILRVLVLDDDGDVLERSGDVRRQ